jgi:hypothetical protein
MLGANSAIVNKVSASDAYQGWLAKRWKQNSSVVAGRAAGRLSARLRSLLVTHPPTKIPASGRHPLS